MVEYIKGEDNGQGDGCQMETRTGDEKHSPCQYRSAEDPEGFRIGRIHLETSAQQVFKVPVSYV